ncbi:hypothetical protein AQUCO_09100015v1 [Aquilegia coerulea]|uniref:non-specific serine/threonine protein kinase n=1 Tax=Aquilegia coerulea TaxID=218851 RepID=A0A2G5C5G3_AQUCA|nr:hypothetical protein AQUCO_09100015v1 [Aquilegia coerulea]
MKTPSTLEDASSDVEKIINELRPKSYSYEDLERFTSKFSEPLGFGGYGEVYKGQFPSGVHIAVKVLAKKDVVEETLMAEVRTLGKAYHRNLVKLYGYCFEHNMKALVYEYIENGSLDRILYENHNGIEWETLYGIAIETAKGIDYLHDGLDERIIHYDIKASNVLLGKTLSPKITDFGLAKLMKRDVSRVPLTRIRGTFGYNAPETWMPSSQVTYKCDVYSFGMMLFEILGNRRNGEGENWFPKKVWEKYKDGQLAHIINDCGITEKDYEKAKTLSMVALWCVQYTPERRPSMNDVVLMLQNKVPVDMPSYPFQFRQSWDSSMLPREVIAEIPPTQEVIAEVRSEATFTIESSYFSRKLAGKFRKKKGSQVLESEKAISLSSPYTSQQDGSKNKSLIFFEGIRQFELEDLLKSQAEMLRKDDFGTSYKAVLDNGEFLCINRLNIIQDEEKRENIETYMEVLGNLRHNNIVSMKAYYFSRDEKLLFSDYMPKGSLFSFLHTNRGVGQAPLDWNTRLKIAAGVACGLDFIHNYSSQSPTLVARGVTLSHGNIKSTNVLIDSTGNPRLTEFGLFAFASATVRSRSNGYRAPETLLAEGRKFSYQKVDIYAFGVLLLEILTGKCPFKNGGSEVVDLRRMVQQVIKKDWMAKVFDSELVMHQASEQQMVGLLEIAMSCTTFSTDKRPSICSVFNMIKDIRNTEE